MNILKFILMNPIVIPLALFFIAYIRAARNASTVARAVKQGGVYMEGVSISSKDYYRRIEERIKARDIIGLKISYVSLPEGSAAMASREYLKIEKGWVLFCVCTFDLGTSQVFTHWQIAPQALWERIFTSIPLIGGLIRMFRYPKTLYKVDVASALNGMIETDIKAVTDELGTDKGIREIAQTDLQKIRKIFV